MGRKRSAGQNFDGVHCSTITKYLELLIGNFPVPVLIGHAEHAVNLLLGYWDREVPHDVAELLPADEAFLDLVLFGPQVGGPEGGNTAVAAWQKVTSPKISLQNFFKIQNVKKSLFACLATVISYRPVF